MNNMMRYAALNEARKRDGRGRFTSEGDNNMRSEMYNEPRSTYNEADRMEQRYPRYERTDDKRMEQRHEKPEHDSEMKVYYLPYGRDTSFRMSYENGEGRRMVGVDGDHGKVEKGRDGSHESKNTMTGEMAEEWVNSMKNADGTKGPHWDYYKAEQVMRKFDVQCDPVVFWACLNAEYSDRCEVNKKFGLDTIEYYVECVKAFWLEDEDAVKDKPCAYYKHIVKH